MASEYAWSLDEILEGVYFDTFYYLSKQIKTRNDASFKRDVLIAHTSMPKELLDMVDENTIEDEEAPLELDKASFAMFKLAISDNPRIQAK